MLNWEFHSDETGDFAPNQSAAVGGLLVCRDHFGDDLADALYEQIVGALPWIDWPLHMRTLGRPAHVLLWLTLWPGAAGAAVQPAVERLGAALESASGVSAAWRRLTGGTATGATRHEDTQTVDRWLEQAAAHHADVAHVRSKGVIAIRTARQVVEQCLEQAIALGDVEVIVSASANSAQVSGFEPLYWAAVERAIDVLLQKPGEHRLVLCPQRRNVATAIGVPGPMSMAWLTQGIRALIGGTEVRRSDARVLVEPERPTVFRGPDVSALAVCADVLCHAVYGRLPTRLDVELASVQSNLLRALRVPLVSPDTGLPALASDGAPRERIRQARQWARPNQEPTSAAAARWADQQADRWCTR